MPLRRCLPAVVAAATLLLLAGDVFAWPNCKEAVASNDLGGAQGSSAGATAASGFNAAILLTLGVVFSMIGAFGWRVWRSVKRAEGQEP